MTSARPRESDRWLLIHWGTHGGGPALLRQVWDVMAKDPRIDARISYSSLADTIPIIDPEQDRAFPIRTYKSAAGLLLGLPRLIVRAIQLRRWIIRHRIGFVYAPMFSIWQSLALPLWLPRHCTYLSSVHDATMHPGDEHPLRLFCQFVESRFSDITVTYSSDVDQQCRQKQPNIQTIRLQLGVEALVGQARSLSSVGTKKALFFGRILKYKGIEIFVEALSILRASGMDITGEVWGAADHPDSLQELVESSADHIEWNVGWVDNDEIVAIFANNDLLVLPYIEASQSAVLALAAGCGVPAVVTPVGGLAEQSELYGNAIVAEHVTASAVAAAMETLLQGPDLYHKLSSCGIAGALGENSTESVIHKLVDQAKALVVT